MADHENQVADADLIISEIRSAKSPQKIKQKISALVAKSQSGLLSMVFNRLLDDSNGEEVYQAIIPHLPAYLREDLATSLRLDNLTLEQLFRAMSILSMLNASAGYAKLLDLLDHQEEVVRFHVITLLGPISGQTPAILEALLDILTEDSDRQVRYQAAEALAQSRSYKALEQLKICYQAQPDDERIKQAYFQLKDSLNKKSTQQSSSSHSKIENFFEWRDEQGHLMAPRVIVLVLVVLGMAYYVVRVGDTLGQQAQVGAPMAVVCPHCLSEIRVGDQPDPQCSVCGNSVRQPPEDPEKLQRYRDFMDQRRQRAVR